MLLDILLNGTLDRLLLSLRTALSKSLWFWLLVWALLGGCLSLFLFDRSAFLFLFVIMGGLLLFGRFLSGLWLLLLLLLSSLLFFWLDLFNFSDWFWEGWGLDLERLVLILVGKLVGLWHWGLFDRLYLFFLDFFLLDLFRLLCLLLNNSDWIFFDVTKGWSLDFILVGIGLVALCWFQFAIINDNRGCLHFLFFMVVLLLWFWRVSFGNVFEFAHFYWELTILASLASIILGRLMLFFWKILNFVAVC